MDGGQSATVFFLPAFAWRAGMDLAAFDTFAS